MSVLEQLSEKKLSVIIDILCLFHFLQNADIYIYKCLCSIYKLI